MAWRTVVTDDFFPNEEGIIYNELASLMSFNESLVSKIYDNFWDIPRENLGSPNPRQDYLRDVCDEFAKKNEADQILVILEYGATRSGKTVGTIAKIVEYLVKFPGARAIGARNTYQNLADSLIPSVIKFLEEHGYVYKEDYEIRSGDRPGLYFKNGSCWVFRSSIRANKAGQGTASSIGGTEYDLAMLEEADEISEEFYKTVVARMSGNATPVKIIFIVENPPDEQHWTYIKFFKDRAKDPRANYVAIHFPTEDNERNLRPGYIKDLEDEYKDSPALYRKFRLGLFTSAVKGKAIFKDYFQRAIHVPTQRALTWNSKDPLWRIWDFGFRRPAMVIGQEDSRTGQIKWLRAHLGADEMLMPFATKMINNCKKWYPNATYIDICDQAGKKRNPLSDKTEIQVLEGMGLRLKYQYSRIEYGVQLLYQELSSILPGGLPAMIFDAVHCGLLIDAFDYGYTQDPDAKDDRIKPVKDGKFDHCMDCCRYAVVLYRTITNTRVPKKVAKRPYRKMSHDGTYEAEVMRELSPRKGPSYNFGKKRSRHDDGLIEL